MPPPPDKKKSLAALAQTLLEPARDPAGPLAALPPARLTELERLAGDAIDLFVRATSCVEGRNGRLALLHHGLHRLSLKRLGARTVIHNFVIRRPEGWTEVPPFPPEESTAS